MMANKQVELRTSALRMSDNNIYDVLKSFYDVTYSEVKITRLGEGHFKLQGSQSVIDKLVTKEGPKKWTITQFDDDTCASSDGYSCKQKDRYDISITYSHEISIDFKSIFTDLAKNHTFSYPFIISIKKIDECGFYDNTPQPTGAGINTVSSIVKIDVSKTSGIDEPLNLCNSQISKFKVCIEDIVPKNSWIMWKFKDNPICNSCEYWKQKE